MSRIDFVNLSHNHKNHRHKDSPQKSRNKSGFFITTSGTTSEIHTTDFAQSFDLVIKRSIRHFPVVDM